MIVQESIKSKMDWYFNKAETHMGDALNIDFKEITENKLVAEMPVDSNTIQPFGLLHGGASVVLAETLASVGAWVNVDEGKHAVGVEINANHIRAVKKGGTVTGTAVPLKLGKSIHVWEVRIVDQNGKDVSISRCTLAIINAR